MHGALDLFEGYIGIKILNYYTQIIVLENKFSEQIFRIKQEWPICDFIYDDHYYYNPNTRYVEYENKPGKYKLLADKLETA